MPGTEDPTQTTPNPDVAGGGPSASTTLDTSVYAPDGKKWKDKFHGAVGRADQIEAQMNKTLGARDASVASLEAQVAAANVRLQSGVQEIAALGDLNTQRAELQIQLDEANKRAALVSRYEYAMQFPELLQLSVEVKEKDPETGEEKVVGTRNPILALLASSAMPEDKLQQTLADLAAQMTGTTVIPTAPVVPSAGLPPTPTMATPVPEVTEESLTKRAQEASSLFNATQDPTHGVEFDKVLAELHELRRNVAKTA